MFRRQKEIIEEAISLIEPTGIAGLTTQALSAADEISEPALYRHFSNKAEIIRAMTVCFNGDGKVKVGKIRMEKNREFSTILVCISVKY